MSCLDDNDVLALIAGKLPPERLSAIEAHLDGCGDCRQLAAAAAGKSGPAAGPAHAGERPAPSAQQLGRYSVLQPVGAGAMGIVYAAYDPVLDRRVALKLLHAVGGEAQTLRARLLREAQAMARLSHPNVITVHDVGTVHEQVFVAMEFVAGSTLSQWLAKKPGWRETLRVFLLAGRGLAAAHAAGLVHRDFKPDNVLIGEEGRVVVTDFGLARTAALDASAAATNGARAGAGAAGERPASALTEHGALVGSPAYMPPEQLRGEPVDARADQFSFSVALYEGLYGERPFAGADVRALLESIERGQVRPEPAGTRVPGWLRRVVLRGISARPQARFPTLPALLDALSADPASARRRAMLAGATICALALVIAGVRWQSGRAQRACAGAEAMVASVWTPELKTAARAAFAATQVPYAPTAWALAEKALDGYAADWARLRTDACEATAVRKEQSAELLDLRMACLDDRLRELSATSALFARADAEVVARAAQLASALTPLAGCSDARALREPGAPTPEQRDAVNHLRDQLAQVRALAAAGKLPLTRARETYEAAKKLGYAPLEAEALFQFASVTQKSGDETSAYKLFPQAAAEALRARVDPLVAQAWRNALLTDLQLTKIDDAALAAEQAQAATSRLGDPASQARLDIALASYARRRDRPDEAQRDCEEAVAFAEKPPVNRSVLIPALAELSLSLSALGKSAQALPAQERAFHLATEEYGPEHPTTAEMENELGGLLCDLGRASEGVPHLEHALSATQNALGPNHSDVAAILMNLAFNNLREDHPNRAEENLHRALQILESKPPTSETANARNMLARAFLHQGRLAEARREYERSIALEQQLTGQPDDALTALARTGLGEVLREEGKLGAARAQLTQSLALEQQGDDQDDPQVAETLESLARVALAEKKLPEARRFADRALAMTKTTLPGSAELALRQALADQLARAR